MAKLFYDVACDLCLIRNDRVTPATHAYVTTKDGGVLHLCDEHHASDSRIANKNKKETSHE